MAAIFDPDARKRPTNLSINGDLLAKARELDINLSATLEKELAEALRRRQREQWLAERIEPPSRPTTRTSRPVACSATDCAVSDATIHCVPQSEPGKSPAGTPPPRRAERTARRPCHPGGRTPSAGLAAEDTKCQEAHANRRRGRPALPVGHPAVGRCKSQVTGRRCRRSLTASRRNRRGTRSAADGGLTLCC